jgi:hypothetical protein
MHWLYWDTIRLPLYGEEVPQGAPQTTSAN